MTASTPQTKLLATGLIPVNARGEVLLMQRDDTPGLAYAGMWNLVGGGVEPGESLQECLVREALEEIGIAPQMYAPFGVFEGRSHCVHTYHGRLDLDASELTLGEGQALRFFSPAQALKLPIVPVTLTILKAFFESPAYHRPKPAAAALIVHNAPGDVLLMLRDDRPGLPHPNQWNFVGGQMDAGETPAQCILRENRPDQAALPGAKSNGKKVGRNDPCPCGSGKKYKRCHGIAA